MGIKILVDKILKELKRFCPITVSQSAWPVIDRTINVLVNTSINAAIIAL